MGGKFFGGGGVLGAGGGGRFIALSLLFFRMLGLCRDASGQHCTLGLEFALARGGCGGGGGGKAH